MKERPDNFMEITIGEIRDANSQGDKMNTNTNWKWYGFAGHLIVSDRCAYHLTTKVGNFLISTVGAFRKNYYDDFYTPIGSGKTELFETCAFLCPGEDEFGNPIRGEELSCQRFGDSKEAEVNHYAECRRFEYISILEGTI